MGVLIKSPLDLPGHRTLKLLTHVVTGSMEPYSTWQRVRVALSSHMLRTMELTISRLNFRSRVLTCFFHGVNLQVVIGCHPVLDKCCKWDNRILPVASVRSGTATTSILYPKNTPIRCCIRPLCSQRQTTCI